MGPNSWGDKESCPLRAASNQSCLDQGIQATQGLLVQSSHDDLIGRALSPSGLLEEIEGGYGRSLRRGTSRRSPVSGRGVVSGVIEAPLCNCVTNYTPILPKSSPLECIPELRL